MTRTLLTVLLLTGAALSGDAHAYTITVLPPSTWDANVTQLNQNLGLTSPGIVFEDFEDQAVTAPLQATPSSGNLDFPVSPPLWDGATTLRWTSMTSNSGLVFDWGGAGMDLFGLGLTNINSAGLGRTIIVNGGAASLDVTTDPNLVLGAGRNGYVIVQRQGGDAPITSVEFAVVQQEGFVFDHVAYEASATVPEPGGLLLVLVASALALVRRRAA